MFLNKDMSELKPDPNLEFGYKKSSQFYKEVCHITSDSRYKGVTKEAIESFKNKIHDVIRAEAGIGNNVIKLTYQQMYDMMPETISIHGKEEIIYQVLTKMHDEGFLLNAPSCGSDEHWVEIIWSF